jgi:hypothetical protein
MEERCNCYSCDLVFGYGLEYLLGTLDLERDTLTWLDNGSSDCFQIYFVCQGQGARGWPLCLRLGDNIDIFSMVK